MSTCPTPPGSAMSTSSGTSTRRPGARRSSSTNASTAVGRSPTTTSICCGVRWSATGRRATAIRSGRHRRRFSGPKVMVTDETAGSGGDLLPWMFRKFALGPIVGKRTWGGLVGILGYPVLMDGGTVTAPNLAIFTDEGWVVENEGVAARHRSRADACRRDCRQGPAARSGHSGGAGRAGEGPGEDARSGRRTRSGRIAS